MDKKNQSVDTTTEIHKQVKTLSQEFNACYLEILDNKELLLHGEMTGTEAKEALSARLDELQEKIQSVAQLLSSNANFKKHPLIAQLQAPIIAEPTDDSKVKLKY